MTGMVPWTAEPELEPPSQASPDRTTDERLSRRCLADLIMFGSRQAATAVDFQVLCALRELWERREAERRDYDAALADHKLIFGDAAAPKPQGLIDLCLTGAHSMSIADMSDLRERLVALQSKAPAPGFGDPDPTEAAKPQGLIGLERSSDLPEKETPAQSNDQLVDLTRYLECNPPLGGSVVNFAEKDKPAESWRDRPPML